MMQLFYFDNNYFGHLFGHHVISKNQYKEETPVIIFKIAIRDHVYICIMGELLSDLTVKIFLKTYTLTRRNGASDSMIVGGNLLFQVAYIAIIRYDLPISLITMLPTAETASLYNQLTYH
jgi:hypothetical protein